MSRVLSALGVCLAGALCGVSTAQQVVLAPDASSGDRFGWSTAVSGDTLLAGVVRDDTSGRDAGAVWVFEADANDDWVATAKLLASDGVGGASFGYDVAIDGDVAVVGATGQGVLGDRVGRAYVFEYIGGTWVETAALRGAATYNDRFGWAVAVSNDTVAVGAPRDDVDAGGAVITDAGAVHVFRRGPSGWSLEAVLTAASPSFSDQIGQAVDLDGDVLVAGAPLDDELALDAGAAHVFERVGGAWTPRAKLTSGAGHFGTAVAVSRGTAAIGAPDAGGGQVHLFDEQAGAWVETALLVGSDTALGDQFGAAVALDGDALVVGASENDAAGKRAGACYAFGRAEGVWQEVAASTAPDAEPSAFFGRDVSVDGDRSVAGAYRSNMAVVGGGAVYAMDRAVLTPFLAPPEPDPEPAWFEVFCLCADGAPCGNADAEAGCANSTGRGARLDALGSPSIAADDLHFVVTNLPARSHGLLFMGDPRAEPRRFLGGQLCIQGRVRRFRWARADETGTMELGPGFVEQSQRTRRRWCRRGPILEGETWAFQMIYRERSSRDAPCRRRGRWNTTNGVMVTFTP